MVPGGFRRGFKLTQHLVAASRVPASASWDRLGAFAARGRVREAEAAQRKQKEEIGERRRAED